MMLYFICALLFWLNCLLDWVPSNINLKDPFFACTIYSVFFFSKSYCCCEQLNPTFVLLLFTVNLNFNSKKKIFFYFHFVFIPRWKVFVVRVKAIKSPCIFHRICFYRFASSFSFFFSHRNSAYLRQKIIHFFVVYLENPI